MRPAARAVARRCRSSPSGHHDRGVVGWSVMIRPASMRSSRVVVTASSSARSCVTRSSVPVNVERLLELLDRGQVEVVRRLVEHEAVHAARREQRERRPRALARRQRVGRRAVTWSAPSPNLASSDRARRREQPARGVEARRAAVASPANAARAWSSSPTTTPGPSRRSPGVEREPAEQRVEQRRLAAAVGAEDRDPLAVVDLEVDRPEHEVAAPHDRARRAGRRPRRCGARPRSPCADPSPPTASRRVRLEPLERPVGDLAPWPRRARCCCVRKWRMNLSVSPLFFTFATPCTDHCALRLRAVAQRRRAATGTSA